MFEMIVEAQMSIGDKTVLGGTAKYDRFPGTVYIDGKEIQVLGVSYGIKPPKFALEITRTEENLVGKSVSG